jgi:ferredoxin
MCELSVPEVFTLDEAGLVIVRCDGMLTDADVNDRGTLVPVAVRARVREAAAACPGGCIHCHDENPG